MIKYMSDVEEYKLMVDSASVEEVVADEFLMNCEFSEFRDQAMKRMIYKLKKYLYVNHIEGVELKSPETWLDHLKHDLHRHLENCRLFLRYGKGLKHWIIQKALDSKWINSRKYKTKRLKLVALFPDSTEIIRHEYPEEVILRLGKPVYATRYNESVGEL